MELKGKKILITGSEGFIGSHLVEELLSHEAKIRAFVLYNSFNNWGWLENISKENLDNIEIFTGDVRDYNCVNNAMKDIDVVFHLAALIAIPFSYQSPESYIDTNVKGTLNVLQSARDNACEKILVTSTSEVYGTAQYAPIDEKHPLQGQSPYSASKIGADMIAESFYRSFDMPVTIVRPFNTYGPRQSSRAVIPTVITQLLNGMMEIKLGALHPTRDFLFVKDTVKGFIEIAKSENTIGEEINIASQSEISVGNLARKLINIINPNAVIQHEDQRVRPKKSEVERLFGSNEKIKKITNWKQSYDLDAGLKETIEWFRDSENIKHYKANIYNI
jgi:NAD dependent epimerase/dehydratase